MSSSLGVLPGAGGDGRPDAVAGTVTRTATALPAQLGKVFPALSINWKASWTRGDRGWGPSGVLPSPCWGELLVWPCVQGERRHS